MSKLLKRFNEKIFTKHVGSDSEDQTESSHLAADADSSSVSQPESSKEALKDATEHEESSNNYNSDPLLSETWSVLKNAPSAQGEPRPSRLQKVEETFQQKGDEYKPVVTALQRTVTIQSLEEGIDRYLDGSSALMKALDEVGKIHPIASGDMDKYVSAVWSLEMTRRDNDKRVVAVFVEMRDMMQALLQLRDIKDVDVVAPDGTIMAARLQKLIETTASDIKNCAMLCDTYSKKGPVVKVLEGTAWNSRLLGYVNLFNQRRNEFQLALTIHIACGIDEANQKIDALQAANAEINQKLDMLLILFERFVTPEERKIVEFVNRRGGPEVCQHDLKTLQELAELESKSASAGSAQSGSTIVYSNTISKNDMNNLPEDFRE
ncbi:hypothetical protein Clacol_001201 [Clathrus columnatus]|uniref:Uncharacterized protein n=1 Tax=Clathrus columnatus TaxID=1419009 RepID=A0AAV5A2Z8_9AGAM|nr:hypothetical protein Clacol_001201 [Clathrus columnatus]